MRTEAQRVVALSARANPDPGLTRGCLDGGIAAIDEQVRSGHET